VTKECSQYDGQAGSFCTITAPPSFFLELHEIANVAGNGVGLGLCAAAGGSGTALVRQQPKPPQQDWGQPREFLWLICV
jgi:hypothetical protein